MKLNPDGKTVAAMDCLVPGIGEIIGGSQREDNYDMLTARMQELGLKRGGLRLLPGPAEVRLRPPRRLRPGLRALRHVPDRHGQHPRRHSLPQNRRQLRAVKANGIKFIGAADSRPFSYMAAACPWIRGS